MKAITTLRLAGLLIFSQGLLACNTPSVPDDYLARVGDAYLTREDAQQRGALASTNADSTHTLEQVVEQWVTYELLRQEADRLELKNNPDVQRQIEENERSILINALMQRFYEEESVVRGVDDKRAYFERNKELLKLREPFVRVRYLEMTSQAQAETARGLLLQIRSDADQADSLWSLAINTFAEDQQGSRDLSETYLPERQLFWDRPAVRLALARLRDRQVSSIIQLDSSFHVVQLIERKPIGTVPEYSWIENEITERVGIQARKQLFARQVQRLRNEALSREDLEIHNQE